MPDEPGRNLPARPVAARRTLDRAALDRVLARAAELQAADGSDPHDALSEEQLLELGNEVGLSTDALRLALAEERTRAVLPEESGFVASIAGPGSVGAARVVRGAPAAVLAQLDTWMLKSECLQPHRRQADRLSWEPRRDAMGKLRVGLNIGGRGYHLARAELIAATVSAVDGDRTHVQLVADVGGSRRARVAGGATLATAGTLGGGGLMTIPFVAPDALLLPIALGATALTAMGFGAGFAVARTHRRTALRVQTALEQLLDRLERGELTVTNPGGDLLRQLQDAMKRRP